MKINFSAKDWFKMLVLGCVLGALILVVRKPWLRHKPGFNVLVISLCSMRYQELSAYGWKGVRAMPVTEAFFRSASYVFQNAINGLPWVNIADYTPAYITSQKLFDLGFQLPGLAEDRQGIWIPNRPSKLLTNMDPSLVPPALLRRQNRIPNRSLLNNLEKNYKPSDLSARSALKDPGLRPFFVIVHFKYMHYPLIDTYNPNSGWDYYLTPKEKREVAEELAHPKKYPAKLPFLLLLQDLPRLISWRPEIRSELKNKIHDPNALGDTLGVITNPKYLEAWKRSAHFRDDLKIINKIYLGNMRYMDHILTPYFNLFNEPKLQKQTVLAFIGDHGELQMEHDFLTHGNNLYEPAIKVPFALRFPGHTGPPATIPGQVDFTTIGKLIAGIAKGEVTEANLPAFIQRTQPAVSLLRDCGRTWRGIRYQNRYKYFVRESDGAQFLFDLKKDPEEKQNIAEQRPDLVNKMETLYWKNEEQLKGIGVYNCLD